MKSRGISNSQYHWYNSFRSGQQLFFTSLIGFSEYMAADWLIMSTECLPYVMARDKIYQAFDRFCTAIDKSRGVVLGMRPNSTGFLKKSLSRSYESLSSFPGLHPGFCQLQYKIGGRPGTFNHVPSFSF